MGTYVTFSDEELIICLKKHDQAAFTEIFNRYSPLLYQHTYNKLRNTDEAKDIVQEVFFKLWTKKGDLELKTVNLSGYLYRSTRNAVLDLLRHKTHVDEYALNYAHFNHERAPETDALVREKQFTAIIEAEINMLPPRMREVFNLRRMENLSNKEIAERLGISEETVKVQMKRAIKNLKPKIGLVLVMAYLMNQS